MDSNSRIAYLYPDADGNIVAEHTVVDSNGKRHTNRTVIYPDADDGRDADGYRYRIAPAFRGAATQRPADRRGDGRSGA